MAEKRFHNYEVIIDSTGQPQQKSEEGGEHDITPALKADGQEEGAHSLGGMLYTVMTTISCSGHQDDRIGLRW